LVYAVDSRDSFNSMEKWINQVNQRTSSSVKKVLVANKIDVNKEDVEVLRYEGQEMANRYNLQFLEVSAKSSQNIDQIFFTLAKELKGDL
jgi:Ras-related protein Rab-8A